MYLDEPKDEKRYLERKNAYSNPFNSSAETKLGKAHNWTDKPSGIVAATSCGYPGDPQSRSLWEPNGRGHEWECYDAGRDELDAQCEVRMTMINANGRWAWATGDGRGQQRGAWGDGRG
ncbi:hypothetical protein R3P38DRAFT_2787494 [Favolaschia claudopus]|uniref:Uncharacterized protein n=1 Tax=Favolaschia claudopus TaxID=2862362 RepID=A0AAW0ANY0_9AGAR